jgi:trehalose-phosphatase
MSSADPTQLAHEVHRRRGTRHLVVLCDFDGTLCEFDPDPAAVWLPERMRAALERIASGGAATVGLVSGRRLRDIRLRGHLACDAYYAGLHGLEIEGPGARFVHPAFANGHDVIREIGGRLETELRALPGVFVEDKDVSFVAHYRSASAEVQKRVPELFDRVAGPYIDAGVVRIMHGSCARELMPAIDWDKGSAVDWICDHIERRHGSAWPLYVGDDVTDEDAFSVVRHRGLAVAASDRVEGADVRIDGPRDVELLLNALR